VSAPSSSNQYFEEEIGNSISEWAFDQKQLFK
jgi:hypothetical protein